MPSESQEQPNVFNAQATEDSSLLVQISLEEELFNRATAWLSKHPDWDMDRLANSALQFQVSCLETDDKYPLPDPGLVVCEGLGVNSVEDQVDISRDYLQQAQSELEGDNPSQASRGVWGSVVYGLSAVAIKRGWNHEASGDIADQLGHEFNRPRFGDLVRLAADLYEGKDYEGKDYEDEDYYWSRKKKPDNIQGVVDLAIAFVQELDEFRERQPEPFTIRDGYDQRRLARLLNIPRDQAEKELPMGTVDPNGFSRNPPDDSDVAG